MNEKKGTLSSYDQVKQWLETPAMHNVLGQSLPKGYNVGSWTGAALAYVRTSKEVNKCEPLSIMGSIIIVASFGLRLDGVLGHAYIRALPIKDKRGTVLRHEAQVQLGYVGMVELAYRNPEVQDVEPVIVRANDDIDFRKGTNPHLNHTWNITGERGDPVAVYAGLRFRNGYYSFQIYDIGDVMKLRKDILEQSYIDIEETKDGVVYYKNDYGGKRRKLSEAAANRYPWIGHLRPMVLKTAIRWSSKFWPSVGHDFSRAASLVELDDSGLSQGTADFAAETMPEDLRAEAENLPSFTPDGSKRASVRTMARGDELAEMMAAEATRGELKPSKENEKAPAESKEKSPPPSNKNDPPASKEKNKPPSEEKEAPASEKKSPPPAKKTGKKSAAKDEEPITQPAEPTEQEKAEIARLEREEWERELADQSKD